MVDHELLGHRYTTLKEFNVDHELLEHMYKTLK